jgi:predicted DNA-binding transcriptional regulator AlpA
MNIEERHFVRPQEFAGLYGLSAKHVYDLLSRRLLPATKRKGCGWLIDRIRFEKELEDSIGKRYPS